MNIILQQSSRTPHLSDMLCYHNVYFDLASTVQRQELQMSLHFTGNYSVIVYVNNVFEILEIYLSSIQDIVDTFTPTSSVTNLMSLKLALSYQSLPFPPPGKYQNPKPGLWKYLN